MAYFIPRKRARTVSRVSGVRGKNVLDEFANSELRDIELRDPATKLYLDDTRTTPDGWTHARWPQEVIAAIERGGVQEVSLDFDLGEYGPDARTGKDVLAWMLEHATKNPSFLPPRIRLHSQDPQGKAQMAAAVREILHVTKDRRQRSNAASALRAMAVQGRGASPSFSGRFA